MPVRKSLNQIPPSPAKIVEDEAPMKQGIVTILGSDCERSKAGSIRRTLSADMSSKKWLEQNGFLSPMKKVVSSEALVLPADSSSSSSESEEECEEIPNQDDIWRSIQAQGEREQMQKPAQVQVWASILSQKSENSLLPPPYVHPLVKRSASTLSDKSLDICTESLGSETGSDCFSCYSEIHSDEEKEDRERAVVEEMNDSNPFEGLHVAKYKKSPAQPFPPPLPSISGGHGAALHMHPHRENGRLVLEAVSVPPRNYFHAQRQNGRLLLTLVHAPVTSSTGNEAEENEKMCNDTEEVDEDIHDEEEEEEEDATGGCTFDDMEEEEVTEEESAEKESEFVREQNLSLSSGMTRVHNSGRVTKKPMAVGNINPTWSKADKSTTEEGDVPIQDQESWPPRVPALIPPPTAASFNSYEYWRNKATVSCGFINPTIDSKINGVKDCENQLVKSNKTEQFVPHLRGCKEARRSLLIWEPHCIATS